MSSGAASNGNTSCNRRPPSFSTSGTMTTATNTMRCDDLDEDDSDSAGTAPCLIPFSSCCTSGKNVLDDDGGGAMIAMPAAMGRGEKPDSPSDEVDELQQEQGHTQQSTQQRPPPLKTVEAVQRLSAPSARTSREQIRAAAATAGVASPSGAGDASSAASSKTESIDFSREFAAALREAEEAKRMIRADRESVASGGEGDRVGDDAFATVVVRGVKDTPGAKSGIVFTRVKPPSEHPARAAMVARVLPDGIFARVEGGGPSLEGAAVLSVNGVAVRGPRHAAEMVHAAREEVALIVRRERQHKSLLGTVSRKENKLGPERGRVGAAAASLKEEGRLLREELTRKIQKKKKVEANGVEDDPAVVEYDSEEDEGKGTGGRNGEEDRAEKGEGAPNADDQSMAEWSAANVIENAFSKGKGKKEESGCDAGEGGSDEWATGAKKTTETGTSDRPSGPKREDAAELMKQAKAGSAASKKIKQRADASVTTSKAAANFSPPVSEDEEDVEKTGESVKRMHSKVPLLANSKEQAAATKPSSKQSPKPKQQQRQQSSSLKRSAKLPSHRKLPSDESMPVVSPEKGPEDAEGVEDIIPTDLDAWARQQGQSQGGGESRRGKIKSLMAFKRRKEKEETPDEGLDEASDTLPHEYPEEDLNSPPGKGKKKTRMGFKRAFGLKNTSKKAATNPQATPTDDVREVSAEEIMNDLGELDGTSLGSAASSAGSPDEAKEGKDNQGAEPEEMDEKIRGSPRISSPGAVPDECDERNVSKSSALEGLSLATERATSYIIDSIVGSMSHGYDSEWAKSTDDVVMPFPVEEEEENDRDENEEVQGSRTPERSSSSETNDSSDAVDVDGIQQVREEHSNDDVRPRADAPRPGRTGFLRRAFGKSKRAAQTGDQGGHAGLVALDDANGATDGKDNAAETKESSAEAGLAAEGVDAAAVASDGCEGGGSKGEAKKRVFNKFGKSKRSLSRNRQEAGGNDDAPNPGRGVGGSNGLEVDSASKAMDDAAPSGQGADADEVTVEKLTRVTTVDIDVDDEPAQPAEVALDEDMAPARKRRFPKFGKSKRPLAKRQEPLGPHEETAQCKNLAQEEAQDTTQDITQEDDEGASSLPTLDKSSVSASMEAAVLSPQGKKEEQDVSSNSNGEDEVASAGNRSEGAKRQEDRSEMPQDGGKPNEGEMTVALDCPNFAPNDSPQPNVSLASEALVKKKGFLKRFKKPKRSSAKKKQGLDEAGAIASDSDAVVNDQDKAVHDDEDAHAEEEGGAKKQDSATCQGIPADEEVDDDYSRGPFDLNITLTGDVEVLNTPSRRGLLFDCTLSPIPSMSPSDKLKGATSISKLTKSVDVARTGSGGDGTASITDEGDSLPAAPKDATPPSLRAGGALALPPTPNTPTKIGEGWDMSLLLGLAEGSSPSPSASAPGSAKEDQSPPIFVSKEGGNGNDIDESLSFECRLQDASAVNICMEMGEVAAYDNQLTDKSTEEATSQEGLKAPPPVNRKLNFEAEDFGESLCHASFQSRAIDVTTVYRDTSSDNINSNRFSDNDEVQLAQAKLHALEIANQARRSGNATRKSMCDANSANSGKQRLSQRVGSLSSLKKNLFPKIQGEARTTQGGHTPIDDAAKNDLTLATVDMTDDLSMLQI